MKLIFGTSVLALALTVSGLALAQANEPSADAIKKASAEFSLGKSAYRDEDYVEAAEHFEAADETAPSVNALRAAMTSRHKAGQLDRAATQAALALTLYPADEELRAEAGAIVAEAEEKLFKLTVSCDEPCRLVVGTSLVHGAPSAARVIYLSPGTHAVRASWSKEDGTLTEQVKAEAGGEGAVEFAKPEAGAAAGDEAGAGSVGDIDDVQMDEPDEDPTAQPERDKRKGWSPVVFAVGSVATVGLGVATIVSGVDAMNNPGKDRVRTECAGQGTDCELYQTGESKERRTNILAGVTAGVGLVTILVGAIATDWGGKKKGETAQLGPRRRIEPWIGVGSGVTLGATGRF